MKTLAGAIGGILLVLGAMAFAGADPAWGDVDTTDTAVVVNPPTINANTASAAELQTIPGIGPVLAARIIEARPFRSVEEIDLVNGIGASLMAGIRVRVFVDPADSGWKRYRIRFPNGVEQDVELMEIPQ
jgi:DNA uptake protein ComE-like DNA-binding protein